MPQQHPAITLEKVCKSFGAQCVLKDVSLTLPEGKILVMLGPSGTGKSVLLRCLVGLMKPDSGRIFINGQRIDHLDDRRSGEREELFEIRKLFGMLFQDGALFDDIDVFENVAFPMRQHGKGMSERDIAERVHQYLRDVGLPNAAKKKTSEL